MEILISGWNFSSVYEVEKKLQLYEKFQPGLKYNSFEKNRQFRRLMKWKKKEG